MLCLSTRPEFLLLDESFDGLDPAKRILAKKLLLEYVAERGASVIISSHNLHELEDLCDHVGLLDGQKLLLDCSVDDISASRCKFRVAFNREMDRDDFSDFFSQAIHKRWLLDYLYRAGRYPRAGGAASCNEPHLIGKLSTLIGRDFHG